MAIYLNVFTFSILSVSFVSSVFVSSDPTITNILDRLSYLEKKVAITEQLQRKNEILKAGIIRNEERTNKIETEYQSALNVLHKKITEQDTIIKELKLNHCCKNHKEEKVFTTKVPRNATSFGNEVHVMSTKHAQIGITGQSRILKRLGDSPTVAFTATLSHNLEHLHSGQVVAFDYISLNEGNAYNSSTGIFVCPKSGVYLFSFNLHLELPSSHLGIEVKVNGREIVRSYTSTTATQSKGNVPGTTLVRLNVGDRVWAACFSEQSRIYGGLISHFVGVRIGD